uniref:Uncharacterized protein n=1 Tax=Arundo donax TaxID=35708 RepID=A0A0A9CQH0_ARUDO
MCSILPQRVVWFVLVLFSKSTSYVRVRHVRVHVEAVPYGCSKFFVIVISLMICLCAKFNSNAMRKQFRKILCSCHIIHI